MALNAKPCSCKGGRIKATPTKKQEVVVAGDSLLQAIEASTCWPDLLV